MRKVLAGFLALLMCCTGLTAFAESLTLPEVLPKSYFLEAAQRDYPDWQIRRASYYISGRYEGESARYIEISIYRITDSAIELLELSTLINPIREGDNVSWSVSALIPVEIVSGAADDLCAMTAEEIFYDGIGASFTNAARNLLVPSLRMADESVTQLLSCSKFLFCITENSAGKSILRIAEWDGSSYTNVVATRPQPHLNFLPAHSYDGEMELWLSEDAVVYPRYDAEVGWHINHFFINDTNLVVFQNRIIEGEIDEWYQDNNSEHYGRLTLPHSLTDVDFATFPQTLDEVLAYMDYTGVACTAHDGTPLYATPDGDVLAYCYTRVPMVVISESGDWREVQLGSDVDGLRCWVRAADLAFGADTENVVCTFPTHEEVDRAQEAVSFSSKALPLAKGCAWWMIGTMADGDYLMMFADNEEIFVGTALPSAFSELGETEHGYWNADWAPDGGWDDDDWHNDEGE
ncbi:MAG: hypothetical protein UEW60_08265 [Christensenellales bacterium]|nr:hypothetical protein [Christensenellales bacterium]